MNVDNFRSQISDKDVLELIWKYFECHANQRLTHINFFTFFSSALLVAQYTVLGTNNSLLFAPIVIGIVQIIVSFVFYKIDERTMFLIKHAEKAMVSIESTYSFSDDKEYVQSLKIFTNEIEETNKAKKEKNNLLRQISHRKSYRILLISFAVMGILGSIWGMLRIVWQYFY